MIYIVTAVYNRKRITEQYLRCLYNQTYKEFKIVIFDDGSTDGTAEMIKLKFPEVVLLKGDGNYWWTKSVNEGFKYALEKNADYILSIDDDVEIQDDYIENFVKIAHNEPDIIMGSVAYDVETGELLFAGGKKDWVFARTKENIDLFDKRTLEKKILVESDSLPGRGLWIPAKVFKNIGMFDERRFPHHAADIDFTIRAKKANFKIYCNMKTKVFINKSDWGIRRPMNKNIFKYLTSQRSAGNFKVRWKFAFRHCPKRYLLQYLVLDTVRTIGAYFKKWIKTL